MGTFHVPIGVANPRDGDFHQVSALVDTGATYSMMPQSLLNSLSLTPMEQASFGMADGSRVEYDIGEARFNIDGRERTCTVIFGPEDQYLLGAVTLEDFGLVVDPTHPNPRLIPAAELLL